MSDPGPKSPAYDVVIIGGALSGAATAVLLLSERPSLRVLIIEKSTAFSRRVGEATIEISTYFLRHCLGLTHHLNHCHLVKNGLRFWFANERARTLADCSEVGGQYLSRVPAYLVDRAVLDEEVLRRAVELGAELWRPASVQAVQLKAGGQQTLTIRRNDSITSVETRWVVDASGVAALLARREGWWRPNDAHPTTAVWSRWSETKDFDSLEITRKHPEWAAKCFGIRGTATNHFMGDGWWAWWIALKGGDVSIGVVFDERLVEWPSGGALGDRLKEFLLRHPVARELMAEAQWQEGDVHWRKRLPYFSTTYAGDGFALVGDAAAFLDPFYSPGMDWISFSASSAAQLILAQQNGEAVAPLVAKMNEDYARSYQRWFTAIYKDKYEYMGEFDLMRLAFLLDVGLYYLGVASQPFMRGRGALREPYYSTGPSTPFYHVMRIYNRRFARIARSRRARGQLGRFNDHRRALIKGFSFGPATALTVLKALLSWCRLELIEGWRTWMVSRAGVVPKPNPASTMIAQAQSR
ncbi:MAG TPA: NAD(P)/FAD-dependent oxidoreductase [Verrucomicrobiae bacterium]|jgi:flavin-dependent dehydrogenase